MSDHFDRINQALDHHEAFRYSKARTLFAKEYRNHPNCACTIYNLANTNYMLGRYERARELLEKLIALPVGALRAGCPDSFETPKSFKADAHFLMFLVLFHDADSWDSAYLFAKRHLKLRRRGQRSIWTKRHILKEIAELKAEYDDGN